jgi:Domain of unknown function (DUF4936)
MNSLYVYYKVQCDQAPALQTAVVRMQSNLRSAMPGLAASLQHRTNGHAMPSVTQVSTSIAGQVTYTWMEAYHFNGHADERAWQQLMERLQSAIKQLPPGIVDERHEEWFTRTTIEQR